MKIINISFRAFLAKLGGVEATYSKVEAPDGCAKDGDYVEGEFKDVTGNDRMIEDQTPVDQPEAAELSKRKR